MPPSQALHAASLKRRSTASTRPYVANALLRYQLAWQSPALRHQHRRRHQRPAATVLALEAALALAVALPKARVPQQTLARGL